MQTSAGSVEILLRPLPGSCQFHVLSGGVGPSTALNPRLLWLSTPAGVAQIGNSAEARHGRHEPTRTNADRNVCLTTMSQNVCPTKTFSHQAERESGASVFSTTSRVAVGSAQPGMRVCGPPSAPS